MSDPGLSSRRFDIESYSQHRHLSGDMIRKLREQQMAAAAAKTNGGGQQQQEPASVGTRRPISVVDLNRLTANQDSKYRSPPSESSPSSASASASFKRPSTDQPQMTSVPVLSARDRGQSELMETVLCGEKVRGETY